MARLWLSCLGLLVLVGPVAANMAPTFPANMSTVTLPEDLPVGDEAFWLVAEDRDGDSLTYGISGTYAYFFSVNSSTGQVKIASPLDSDGDLYTFSISISVTDNFNSPVQKQMFVIVDDRNDNAPVFQNTNFTTSISETEPVGFLVFTAKATDKDSGSAGAVRYFIKEIIPNTGDNQDLFRILSNGSIVLNGNLDYNSKSSFYQLKLQACDMGGILNNAYVEKCSQFVYLSINVIDEPNLDPQFVREFYAASVPEDSPPGTSVLRVEAVDGDRGIKDSMNYSISNTTRPHWFTIWSDGIIRVKSPLDREQLLQENEEVLATETNLDIYGRQASASVWVTLTVTDVNDHQPRFYNCSLSDCTFSPQEAQSNFTGSVEEHTSIRIPVNLIMAVHDPDKGKNGTFLLDLAEPSAFSVSPQRAVGSAEVQVLVRTPAEVDYEKHPVMLLEVVATDMVSGNVSVAWVTIHLIDINDHSPTFPQSQYNLSITEHCRNGQVVTDSIHATDGDQGQWGDITYSLLPGSGADIFQVDAYSGKVTVRSCELLDREAQAVFYVTLQATDSGGLFNTTTLHITLLDANDQEPQVIGSYNIFVREETDNVSVTIKAIDADQPGTNNSLLQFTLLPSPWTHNFSLNPDTGVLTNVGPLDREAIDPVLGGRIMLPVRVSDCGEPPLSTQVEVTITVEDINDNLPIFSQSSYNFSVTERVSDVQVGEMEATDADQTEANNRISFTLEGVGANNFVIRSRVLGAGHSQGVLWLPTDVSLDFESKASYYLLARAENSGPEAAQASATVLVQVKDVNDEAPMLDPTSLRGISVAENGSIHGLVATVVARDNDTTAQLEVQLVGVHCTKAGQDVGGLCQEWFSVQPNGSVLVNQSQTVDYEACDLVTLVVRACDLNTEPNFPACSTDGNLPITILDVNDNAPYFLPQDKTFVIIPELVSPDQQVASVQARDEDSGNNGAIRFSILKTEFLSKDGTIITFQGFFRIVTFLEDNLFTGNIELVTNLDANLNGTYQVTVQAQDTPAPSSWPALQAQTTLNLFTVEKRYRLRLQFSTSKEQVGARQDEIKEALAQATRTTVYVVIIQDLQSATRARSHSYMDAYFVFSNGTALTLNELSVMIRSDEDAMGKLLQLGLVVLGEQGNLESSLPQVLTSVIVGLGVALALLIVIMATALVCVRKSYQRKLRAVMAAKEARKTLAGVTPGVFAIPGTNLYTTDRANPMLNLDTKDLGFESQSSSDLDHISLNSLDENSVDLGKGKPEVKEASYSGTEADTEPLTEVLSGRKVDTGAQQTEKSAFTNPGLDTTDV
ncbi:cadherin-related family member 2 isoform X2 [Erinaceus europaeus]|uniref:Cadherin-related family member 2 isoform X2 n=1 Tax=Erinaceus europaeus TaxID=9365 RepID=A0ABM3XWI3_ERIEU|nr:cadherin-related family member 2 isoform X2 [Erinaceus europaeus]